MFVGAGLQHRAGCVVEVLFDNKPIEAWVEIIEERFKAREVVLGGGHLGRGAIGKWDSIASRERELLLRRKRPFDVEMELSLGQARNEFVEGCGGQRSNRQRLTIRSIGGASMP